MTNPGSKLIAAGTLSLVCAALAPGQESQAPEQETTVLPLFEVNATNDFGYVAGSSLLGGRLNTELRDTPSSISVITREFLDDLGVFNFTDAAAWVTNSVSQYETEGENQFNDYNVRFRNLSINEQSRNFFSWFVNADGYNTERLDFARGPNSVVFGSADIGGVGNITTKQAHAKRRASASALTQSFGGHRATLDVNQPLTKSLFLRVNALSENLDGWRDFERREREGAHVTATWNITPTTTVRAEYEYGEIDRVIVGRGVFNGFNGWDRSTFVSAPRTSGSFTGGINRFGSDYLVYAPGSGQEIVNWRNFGNTSNAGTVAQMLPETRPELGWRDDVVIPSHEFHYFAPNTRAVNPYHTYSLFVNANPFENLFLEGAYNHQQQEREIDQLVWQSIAVDVNNILPSGAPNPYVGEYYADSRTRQQFQRNDIDDWRLAAAYQLKFDFADINLLGLGGHRINRYRQSDTEFVRVNGTGTLAAFDNAANRVQIRRYLSLRDVDWSVPGVDPSIARWATFGLTDRESHTTYLQTAMTAKWLEGRKLSTTVGLRHDIVSTDARGTIVDPVTREYTGMTDYVEGDSRGTTTKTGGAACRLTEWMSVFTGYSESFKPASEVVGIDGSDLAPEENSGIEGGIRFYLLDEKLNVSAVYYDNQKDNIRIAGPASDINAIWADLGRPDRVPTNYNDTSSNKGTGWEFEVAGEPVKGLRITGNFALPEAIQTKGLTATAAYLQANLADWQAGAAALTDQTVKDRVLQNIADVQSAISAFPEGRELLESFDYTANLFATYRFQNDWLKGFWIGGGVNFRGKRIEDYNPTTGKAVLEDGYELLSANIGYETRFGDVLARFQINVTNLLDTEIVRASRYQQFTNSSIPGGTIFAARNYLVLDPRRIQFSATFTF